MAVATLDDEPTGSPKGLLSLPSELREQVYELVVMKPMNTITMLTNHDCSKSEVSASQPALSQVNHQLRDEVLPTFYSNNVFQAEVSDLADLATAQRWLVSIGDANVGCLKRLMLCGWTRVPFGHMLCRRWVKVVMDLKDGTMDLDGSSTEPDQHPQIVRSIENLKAAYRDMVKARAGRRFDVKDVVSLLDGFHCLCVAH